MKNSDLSEPEDGDSENESGKAAVPKVEIRTAHSRPPLEAWLTRRRALFIVFILWAFVYLPGLGTQELKGEEARRILPARTMIETGDYVLPQIGGQPYNRKPPLINWAIAASFKLTGIQNEWTARAPSALFVLILGLGITCAAGALAKSPLVGMLAAIFLLTSAAIFDKGRLAEIEPLYIACTALAFGTWSASWVNKGNPWVTWFVPGIFLGLGMLAKGPVHLLFYYVPVCWCLAISNRWNQLVSREHLASLIPLIAPVAVWGAMVSKRTAEVSSTAPKSGDVWLDQLIGRIAPENFDLFSWIFTPFEVLINFLPWFLLLLVFLYRVRAVRRNGAPLGTFTDDRDPERLKQWVIGTAWGTGLTALAITLLPSSEARYADPGLPAAAILLALATARLNPQVKPDRDVLLGWRSINRVLLAIAAAILLCLPPVTLFAISWQFDSAAWFALGCIDCVLLIALGFIVARRGTPATQAIASACLASTIAILFAAAVLPAAKSEDDVRPIGEEINAALPEDAQLCVLNPGIRPFLFYVEPGYTETIRSSEIPEDTTHVLTPRRIYQEKLLLPDFKALEPKELIGIVDKRDEDFVLLQLGGDEPEEE
ncbi:glycosyltransferase family 39 protein [Verrucomicrobiales bacterium]|nr:glycosyltransferase family 39 protein [Verrucomicrobiales bacterium]